MARTYYDVLGVPPDADTAEIEAAYRDRLKETHPDVSDEADAGEETKVLIRARDVLTDEAERARYDRLGHETYRARAEGEPGASPGESADEGAASAGGTGGSAGAAGAEVGWGPDGWRPQEAAGAGVEGVAWGETARAERRRGEPDGSESGTRHAWTSEAPYTVGGEDRGLHPSRLFPDSQSIVLLVATFALYPVFLGAAVFPPFPLAVNAVLGVCTLFVVAFLQSMPEVGIAVFAGWTVLLPPLLVALGVDLWSLLGLALVLGVVLPLGFSALTRAVIRT